MKKQNNELLVIFLAYIGIVAVMLVFSLLTGCKKKETTVITPVDIINSEYKPTEDSLRGVIYDLRDSVNLLKKQVIVISKQKSKTLERIIEIKAIEPEDTAQLVSNLLYLTNGYEEYIIQQDKELSLQGQIISTQDSLIDVSYSQLELQKKKTHQIAIEYTALNNEYKEQGKKLNKSQKSLRRSKWVNSVSVPLVIIGGTSIIAPPYTLPAVGVGVGFHFILKPKKK